MYATFENCITLKNIVIKNTKTIESCDFKNCYNLQTIYCDSSLSEIHDSAFENCYKLEKVYLPKTVKLIQENAFINCKNLKTVVFY